MRIKAKKEMIQIIKSNLTKGGLLPVLNQVCVKDGEMTVTDLERYVTTPCDKPDGVYTLVGKDLFLDPSADMDDFPPPFDIDGAIVKEKDYRAENPKCEFPPLIQHGETEAQTLAEALNGLKAFQSKEETRRILNGVCFDFDGEEGLTLAATDGKRLALTKTPCTGGIKGRFAVPTGAINALITAFRPGGVKIYFYCGEYASFIFEEGVRVECRLIQGTYPEYPQVIPASAPSTLAVDADAWTTVLKEAAVMSRPMQTEFIDLDIDGDCLISFSMISDVPGLEKWEKTLQTSGHVEEPIQIRFHLKKLRDCMDRAPDEVLLDSGLYPVRFDKNGVVDSILMPIRRY
jgi:hypothetical protein